MAKESISNHLLELRTRLLRVIILFGILVIAGIPFAAEIYSFVAAPLISMLPDGSSMIATEVASPFMAPIKLVIYVAFLFSMPWLFYQAWMFISPGLYKNEKRFTAPLMLSTIILFFTGVSFAFFIVCPIIFKFFIGMAPDSIQIMTDISQYLSFIFKLVFAFGIAFEIPIATILLVKSGIASKSSLAKARPYLIVLFLVIGMLLTPPDIFSQLFLALPMWILFELGLLLSRDKS
ncbi:MAG: twin-arginine translocase subunit TatC [Gammaproteobacteria bacterium]|nr:twin-arginine translocase subunit TatC [Gammaproteobacteria bacterium]|tara:strand:- start:5486 stop:6190 length:705 start_codon:yes stop_codon:yes gene_type:complete